MPNRLTSRTLAIALALAIVPAAGCTKPSGGASSSATQPAGGGTEGDNAMASPTDPDRVAKLGTAFPAIDSIMRAFAARTNVPGIAYGVIVDGKLAHVGTSGFRELSSKSPVDTGTVFRIASMTKSFTAVAILQLRDAGKLSLEDPAERYVPELAGLHYPTTDSPKITIRHLLSHSTGFPEDNPWGDRQLADTDEQMAEMIRSGIPFSTAPGTNYEYSNYAFAILGRIVTKVSGMPYPKYISEHVLQPLGMSSTTLQSAEVDPARLAHGYRWQDGQWLEEEQLPDGSFGPMGGMLTSIADLSRWVGFMLDAWPPRDGGAGDPLSRASRREMQQVIRYQGASAVRDAKTGAITLSAGGYGYGLGVRESCLFHIVVSHTGGLPGFGSIMLWLPDYGVGIVGLGNVTYTSWRAPVDQALDALARTGALEPRAPTPAPILTERRDQVTRLVSSWDDALADSVAAMNLYLDETKDRRRAAIEKVRDAAGGSCQAEGPFVAANALRGRWRMRCAKGDLVVSITLAPTIPAGVQHLDVRPIAREESIAPAPTCRSTT
jgi:CubicO group peptidase (beta-lactamase class C family)